MSPTDGIVAAMEEGEVGARVYLLDAIRQEEHMSLRWIVGAVLAGSLHALYELPLRRVDSYHRPCVY